jgi:[glutamine synthetase] adenylyltransferase / [glutamine synthetase]-adenylyl-L-tyrosine phosphorylase
VTGAGPLLPDSDAQALIAAFTLLWRLHAATRLLGDGTIDWANLGEGGRAFLLRETGALDAEALARELAAAVARAEAAVTRLVGAADRETGDGAG